MTEQEKQMLRVERVKTLFSLTGDEFFDYVKMYFRDGDPGPSDELRECVNIEDHTLCNRRWYKIISKSAELNKYPTKKILYLHGGGYVLETGVAQFKFAEFLVNNTGAEIWFPEYPIAPESECLHALKMTSTMYQMMLNENDANEIAIIGDSAGGGLAASLAVYLKELGLPQPNNLILISPGANQMDQPYNEDEEEYLRYLASQEALIHMESFPTIIESWSREVGSDDYRGNAMCGNYSGIAPMMVFAGGSEIMNLQIRHFVDKVKRDGANITYMEKNKCGHEYMVYNPTAFPIECGVILQLLKNPLKDM